MDQAAARHVLLLLLLAVTTTWSVLAPGNELGGSLGLMQREIRLVSFLWFVSRLFSIRNCTSITINGRTIDGKWTGKASKEIVAIQSRYYSDNCLERLGKITKILSQRSRCPVGDLNRAPPQYKSSGLPAERCISWYLLCNSRNRRVFSLKTEIIKVL
jgi:hypothetical protein